MNKISYKTTLADAFTAYLFNTIDEQIVKSDGEQVLLLEPTLRQVGLSSSRRTVAILTKTSPLVYTWASATLPVPHRF